MRQARRQARHLQAILTGTRIIGTAVLLLSAFSGFSAIGSAPAGAAVQPSWEPINVFHVPAGFNPLTASAADLSKLGFPPRPTGPAALAVWRSAMSRVKHWEVPHPVPGTTPVDSPGSRPASAGSGVYTDAAWAGYQVLASAYGNKPIYFVQAEWTVGRVPVNKKYSPSNCYHVNTPEIAQWVGLGDKNGNTSNKIIQAGTLSCSASKSEYRFFTEDFYHNPVFQGPAVGPGDDVYVFVQYEGHGKTKYFLENVTTGVAQHFVDASPLVDESTAEWILEHPGGNKPAMPDFGTVKFWGCAFADQTERDLTGDSTKMIMHKGHGTAITSNVSGDAFSVTWRAGT